jgi:Domain of unknown function (DUF1707)
MTMCGHRNRYRYVSEDPPRRVTTRDPEMRASQEERDRVVDLLRTHAGEGRLEVDELEQRVEAALAARTRGELAALLADLPDSGRPRRRDQRVRAVALGSLAAALLPLLAGIAILALAPHAFAWVGWVAIGWWFFAGLPSAGAGFAFCGHARRRRERRTVVV